MPDPSTPAAAPRPLPDVTTETAFFWTSGGDGVLRLLRCGACGLYVHPPSSRCPRCLSADLAPEAVSGRATLFSYTINHQPWAPGAPVPYVVGLVELVEQPGLRMTTNIVDCAPEDLRIGMALEVTFERQEDVWLPLYRPAQSAGSKSGT